MRDYNSIVAECLEKGILWEDPDFPPVRQSVFYHQTPPFEFVWKRPNAIYQDPKLIINSADTCEIEMGKLGDKWIASCFNILYRHKHLLHRIMDIDQSFTNAYAGIFRFRINWFGKWVEVLVDDLLPTVNGKMVFIHSGRSQQLWPALLEKAYAKLNGSYEVLKYCNMLDGLADFVGGITEIMSMPISDHSHDSITAMFKNSSILTVKCGSKAIAVQKRLVPDMHYEIFKTDSVETNSHPVTVVLLNNPVSQGTEFPKSVIINEALWNSIPLSTRKVLNETTKGFWMLYTDVRELFNNKIEMVHLNQQSSKWKPFDDRRNYFEMTNLTYYWVKGVTAGGCKNFDQTFHVNPQLKLTLNEPDTVIICLHQHLIIDPIAIGFTIVKMPDGLSGLTTLATPEILIQSTLMLSTSYSNSRRKTARFFLLSGVYLILPTTFEPRKEGAFSVSIYSLKTVQLDVLDNDTKMLKQAIIRTPPALQATRFKQYELMFLQMADNQKTIDMFELGELLNMCLPNDYIKSSATIDACRQIVFTLDNHEEGRLNLLDFKDLLCNLMNWQVVFKLHCTESLGVIRVEKLRDVLQEVGFVLPNRIIMLLVLRYMRKDCYLRFADFISCVMHLHKLFVAYRDGVQQCNFNPKHLTITEWLSIGIKL